MERQIELRLVARLKAGDAAAFEAVYEAFRPRLYGFLVRLSRRRDVAEDLLEETWRRSRALESTRVAELTPCWPEPNRDESPFEAAARNETERRVEAALARLPLRDRELLLLVAGEGLTPGEAAAACGVKPEALRKRLQRARERLAAEMEMPAPSERARAG